MKFKFSQHQHTDPFVDKSSNFFTSLIMIYLITSCTQTQLSLKPVLKGSINNKVLGNGMAQKSSMPNQLWNKSMG